jgi:hypothetical protein
MSPKTSLLLDVVTFLVTAEKIDKDDGYKTFWA